MGEPAAATVTIQHVTTAQAALRVLYESTDGPNWRNDTNWLSDKPLSQWYGVSGSATDLTLRLATNGLTGTLPDELGHLTGLAQLDVSCNQLTGTIPGTVLATLAGKLVSLDVAFNQFSGSIPAELGSLTNLAVLGLSRNQLSGPIPTELWSLTGLVQLWLSGNEGLNGSIPSEAGNLTNLEFLYLQDTSLSGPIPISLKDLSNLSELDFSNTDLCALMDDAFQEWAEGLSKFTWPECTLQPVPGAPTISNLAITSGSGSDASYAAGRNDRSDGDIQ